MSVVIVGGNERMARQYEDLCREYSCRAKIFMKTDRGIQNFGTPDLLVLFTSTIKGRPVFFSSAITLSSAFT